MNTRERDWGWLAFSLILILAGIKMLARGHVQHWLLPEFQASGGFVTAAGTIAFAHTANCVINHLMGGPSLRSG